MSVCAFLRQERSFKSTLTQFKFQILLVSLKANLIFFLTQAVHVKYYTSDKNNLFVYFFGSGLDTRLSIYFDYLDTRNPGFSNYSTNFFI